MEFPSVEIAFQAAKVRHPLVRRVIASARTAEAAKKVVSDVGTRPDWDEVQSKILKDLLQQKFSVPELRQKLVDTWDANLEDTDDSENLLGRLLMKLREVEMVEEWIEWRYYGGNDRKSDDNAAEQGQATPDNGGDIELTLE